MLSTPTTRWSAATGMVCVLVLVAAWFLLIGPRRSEAVTLEEQRASADAANEMLEDRIAELQRQFGELPARQGELKAIRRQLPRAADVPDLVRNLSSLADLAGVTLDSVTPGTPRTLSPGVPGREDAIVAVPVSIEVTGTYVADTLYLRHLQTRMTRAFLVTEISANRATSPAPASGGAQGTGTSATAPPALTAPTVTTPPALTAPAPTASATAPAPESAPEQAPRSESDDFEMKITAEVYALVDPATLNRGAGGPAGSAPAAPAGAAGAAATG